MLHKKHNITQLALFSDIEPVEKIIQLPAAQAPVEAERTYPLLVADEYGFELQHYIQSDHSVLYAVLDWVAGITHRNDAREVWKSLKRTKAFNSTGVNLHRLNYVAKDGKKRLTDFANDYTLYLIAAHLRTDDPESVLIEVKRYLAKLGVAVDKMRLEAQTVLSPEEEAQRLWQDERGDGKVDNRAFKAALSVAVSEMLAPKQYALAQNNVYFGLWQRTAAELRKQLKLKPSQSLRDNQPREALAYQRIAEAGIARALGNKQELTFDEANAIILKIAAMIGQQANQYSEMLNIDLATGMPLLEAVNHYWLQG